jgi:hypothetical protein
MNNQHIHRKGCQTFRFVHFQWCITYALELIAAHPAAARLVPELDISGLGQFLPLQPAEPGFVKLVVVTVDTGYAATVDLTRPILVTPIIGSSGEDMGRVAIDGWHRIYRALSEGTTHLPGYLLSPATAHAVQIPWR